MHVVDPLVVLQRMTSLVRPGGFVVAQEPITTGGIALAVSQCPWKELLNRDVGADLARSFCCRGMQDRRRLGRVSGWRRRRTGFGVILEELTEVPPGDDSIVLPPLVTVLGRLAGDIRT